MPQRGQCRCHRTTPGAEPLQPAASRKPCQEHLGARPPQAPPHRSPGLRRAAGPATGSTGTARQVWLAGGFNLLPRPRLLRHTVLPQGGTLSGLSVASNPGEEPGPTRSQSGPPGTEGKQAVLGHPCRFMNYIFAPQHQPRDQTLRSCCCFHVIRKYPKRTSSWGRESKGSGLGLPEWPAVEPGTEVPPPVRSAAASPHVWRKTGKGVFIQGGEKAGGGGRRDAVL